MVDTTQTTTEKKLTQSDIRGVFLRSNLFQGSWNFERMQALGFCFSMVPAIRRLYPENNEARKQAIRRHLEFFNTQPFVAAPILGVTLALDLAYSSHPITTPLLPPLRANVAVGPVAC